MYILRLFFITLLCFGSPAFAGDCDALLKFNVNAHKNTAGYEENNTRGFGSYSLLLGYDFLDQFIPSREVNWLDVGGGYGLAALSQVVQQQNVDATVINSQDNWSYLLNLEAPPPVEDRIACEKVANVGHALGVKRPLCLTRGVGGDLGWSDFIAQVKVAYENTLKSDKFHYEVGFAEKILPDLMGERHVITDVFGAYLYSADRLTLLDLYYEKLAVNGKAYIVFGSNPHMGQEFAAINKIKGHSKRLEEALMAMYPTVFQIRKYELDTQWVRVLEMTRSPRVEALNLQKRFEILSVTHDKNSGEVMQQIPQTLLRYRPRSADVD